MFQFGMDRKTLYIIIAILVIMSFGRYLTNTSELLSLLLTLPAVLIAITFHEFAHAYAADKLGDDTPRRQGRLSLNPFAHIDLVGFIMLIFAGFGWGKPVEINPRNFNRDRSMSASEAIVSVAGPLMNFVLAIVFSVILGIVLIATNSYIKMTSYTMSIVTSSQLLAIIVQIIMSCISINLGLGIFNLIPLPPLDGSKILRNFLPYNAKEWMDRNYQILYIVFIIIWVTPIASTIISPILSGAYNGLLRLVLNLFGRII